MFLILLIISHPSKHPHVPGFLTEHLPRCRRRRQGMDFEVNFWLVRRANSVETAEIGGIKWAPPPDDSANRTCQAFAKLDDHSIGHLRLKLKGNVLGMTCLKLGSNISNGYPPLARLEGSTIQVDILLVGHGSLRCCLSGHQSLGKHQNCKAPFFIGKSSTKPT